MAAAPKQFEFTVTGTGQFPVDMLRYDSCWPATESDSTRLGGGPVMEPRSVTVRGLRRPTVGRWKSFGWSVSL